MRVHFIAIGGSAMHNLAIALHKKGFQVSGSDDEIFEPSKSRLDECGLLPKSQGWDKNNITTDIEAVILGMHAREDNPELIAAKELGLKIYSYPEYMYEQTKDKTRIVIGGSHGKTSITSMIMHVLKYNNVDFDYMVGAQIEGFDTMVKLTKEAKFAIFEGDEYLSSPIDLRPKFHLYRPNIALLSGIAWDHINVFKTFEIYVEQFKMFVDLIEPDGSLTYFSGDEHLVKIASEARPDIKKAPYSCHKYKNEDGKTFLLTNFGDVELKIFGEHNLQNISGAKNICHKIGLSDKEFYKAIASFKGAAKRLQLLVKNKNTNVYLDFAHSPSKLKATTQAVKKQFPERKLIACMELHTFSSLSADFLKEYKDSMAEANKAIIYFNPETIKHKRLDEITPKQVKDAFGGNNVEVFTDSVLLQNRLLDNNWDDSNLLLMSSGNFSGINFKEFAKKIVG
ncbi:MAG TPA: peptidoglycan synthetase [Bacteroidales bacterium]|nr:MAG: peptidoglycan synthetase [Bacteroidetes bacterium GWF2_33_38]HBF89456.1 peptidoglycan synthetase [Bacteroidales bacterium]